MTAKAWRGHGHHPVEDVGTGIVRARIEFKAPSEMGMADDALENPDANLGVLLPELYARFGPAHESD